MDYSSIDLKIQTLKTDNVQYQVTSSCFDKHLSLHQHDFIEIEFVLSGYGKEIINGIEHELKSGTLCIILPWHMHEIIPNSENPLEMVTCSFKLEMFIGKNLFFELDDLIFSDLDALTYTHLENADLKIATDIFSQLLLEDKNQNQWKNIMFKAKISEIFVLFDRKRKTKALIDNVNRNLESNQVIWDIISFIHLCCNKDISLLSVAQRFHVSEKDLNILLERHTGLNFNNLLNEIRIRIACTFLLIYPLNLPELSMFLGYKDTEIFIKTFKRFKRLDPLEFKKIYHSVPNIENTMFLFSKTYSEIIYYLHLNYKNDLKLADIAQQFHFNENYLSSLIKSQTGQDFSTLLDEVRIFHSCEMLDSTDR